MEMNSPNNCTYVEVLPDGTALCQKWKAKIRVTYGVPPTTEKEIVIDCNDQRTKERCKECNDWTKDRSGKYATRGRCAVLSAENNILKRRERKSALEPMLTWESFICPFFTGKPKGPFIVCEGTRDSWTIRYLPHNSHVITAWSRGEASRACRELNSLWERRE